MTRYEIIVPWRMNDGTPYDTTALEGALLSLFGGFTKHESAGAWSDNSTVYHDNNTVYTMDTESNADIAVREIAARVKQEAQQQAVYTTKQTIEVELV